MQDDETVHILGLGETETLPDGAITEHDAIPEMPPGSAAEDLGRGGDLDATDMAQPTSTVDTTGDRATGLTGG